MVELFEHLNLPVFDGVEAALEGQRKLNLDHEINDSSKQRRIQLKLNEQWMHSVARCDQRSMATILMAVMTVTLTKMNSSHKGRRSIQLEGRANHNSPTY